MPGMRPRVSAVLLRRLRQSPTLVWAPLRLLPLVVNTAYLTVLHGTMTPTGTVALTEGKTDSTAVGALIR